MSPQPSAPAQAPRGGAPAASKDPSLPLPSFARPAVMITTPAALQALATRLASLPRFAVDLESDSMYHYFEKVCLIQITAGEEDYILDPLALGDLSCLQPVFADPTVEKIFHSADNDLNNLVRHHQLEVSGLFDTQVAAQLAGEPRLALSELVAAYFQVRLDKRFQLYNWSLRPLKPEHLLYARSDTHYLEALRDILWAKVEARGRSKQVKSELRFLEKKRSLPRDFEGDDCLRLDGAQKLEPKAQKVLRSLFVARDAIARHQDVPPFRIVPNDVLLNMARQAPLHLRELPSFRGLHPSVARDFGPALLAAVKAGLAPEARLPRLPPHPPRPPGAKDAEPRLKLLKAWRAEKALAMGLEPALVASTGTLTSLAKHCPRSLAELEAISSVRDWQVEEFGQEWLELLKEGRSA